MATQTALEDKIRYWVKKYAIEILVVNSLITVAFVATVSVLFIINGNKETGSPSTTANQTEQSDTTTTVPTPTPTEIPLSGSGHTATEKFKLQAGLATFTFTYEGDSNFVIDLLDDLGNNHGLVANEIGTSKGSEALQVTTAGDYILDVDANGPWTVTIKQ